MDLASKYDPQIVESKWYQYWLDNKLFSSKPDGREPYTVVIPPPNVTGVLHMGHMLNNTIQDILVRRARMEGKNACWVPGTDHASIATEAKVVNKLAQEGIKKTDLTREQFLEHAWDCTVALSSNSCAAWVVPATGTVRLSLWTRPAAGASSRCFATCIIKVTSTVACVWSTGIRRHRQPSPMRR